jgi:hypothetical protein
MTLLPSIQRLTDLLGIAYVKGEQLTLSVDLLQGFLCLVSIAGIIDDNLIAILCQSDYYGASDATATACY